MSDLFQCKCGGEDFFSPQQFTEDCAPLLRSLAGWRPIVMCVNCHTKYEKRKVYEWNQDTKEDEEVERFVQPGKRY